MPPKSGALYVPHIWNRYLNMRFHRVLLLLLNLLAVLTAGQEVSGDFFTTYTSTYTVTRNGTTSTIAYVVYIGLSSVSAPPAEATTYTSYTIRSTITDSVGIAVATATFNSFSPVSIPTSSAPPSSTFITSTRPQRPRTPTPSSPPSSLPIPATSDSTVATALAAVGGSIIAILLILLACIGSRRRWFAGCVGRREEEGKEKLYPEGSPGFEAVTAAGPELGWGVSELPGSEVGVEMPTGHER